MGREDALSTLLAATYVPNPFGLHHMLGNVGEWVADCHISSIEGAPRDGTAWQEGDFSRHINVGGNWHDAWQSLAGQRAGLGAPKRGNDVGFRGARSLD